VKWGVRLRESRCLSVIGCVVAVDAWKTCDNSLEKQRKVEGGVSRDTQFIFAPGS